MSTTQPVPPAWAEYLLRLSVGTDDFDHVSGDLLEAYRDTMYAARGPRGADRWYVRQVLGFVWRRAQWWVLLFAFAFIARTMLDWLVPATDFHDRAAITTYAAIGIVFLAGLWAAWRSGSYAAGPLFAAATAAIAAPIKMVATLVMLAIWHDAGVMSAIGGSGGLAEDLTLPILVIVPAIALGVIAGLLGATLARGRRAGASAMT